MAASEVAVPATAMPASTRPRTSAGTSASMIAPASSERAASSSGVGGSACRWRSVWRTEPMRVETWKPGSLPGSPVTYSVLPPPMSITSVAGARGAPGGGAEEGEAGLLVA